MLIAITEIDKMADELSLLSIHLTISLIFIRHLIQLHNTINTINTINTRCLALCFDSFNSLGKDMAVNILDNRQYYIRMDISYKIPVGIEANIQVQSLLFFY